MGKRSVLPSDGERLTSPVGSPRVGHRSIPIDNRQSSIPLSGLPPSIKNAKARIDNPHARLADDYSRLALSFEANRGQTDPQVYFLARGGGYTLFLTGGEVLFTFGGETANHKDWKSQRQVLRPSEDRKNFQAPVLPWQPLLVPDPRLWVSKSLDWWDTLLLDKTSESRSSASSEGFGPEMQTVLRMKLVGANQKPEVSGADELPGKVNYFLGNDPKKWHTNIPTFSKAKYQDIYPGVDLVYYGNQQQLEYDFIVSPGSDPRQIKLALTGTTPDPRGGEGAQPAKIDGNGDLLVQTAGGEIRFHKPSAYQWTQSSKRAERRAVGASYVLTPDEELRIQLAYYDVSQPLVIDPIVTYSTYLGGRSDDLALGAAVDASGSLYLTGSTTSPDFPKTPGAFQTQCGCGPAYSGASDAFVTKINAAGSALVYSTFLGGSRDENFPLNGGAIAVDSSGNAYVTGTTISGDFPVTPGAFQTTNTAQEEVFVTKLNPTGSGLVYSTYLGGSATNQGVAIAVDSAGSAYVTGNTNSADFPVTLGAYETFCCPSGFVTKFNASGSALVYSTFFDAAVSGIAVDGAGNAYITGSTASSSFPTTPGAFQTAYAGGDDDAFVAKLNAAGSARVYSTYLGGTGRDQAGGIAIDAFGNAYVAGGTNSPDFPTINAAQAKYAGAQDGFVSKLSPSGSALVYSTYLGGSGYDAASAIAVDTSGSAYVTGTTGSTDFPTTADAFQTIFRGTDPNYGSGGDAFVTQLAPAGDLLTYSTYLGGGSYDIGDAIAVDASRSVYVAGWTASKDFPTVNPLQPTNNSQIFNGDAFMAKFSSQSALIGGVGTNNPQATIAEPVSTGNGNHFYTHTDFATPGRGLRLVLQRAYNTLDAYAGPLGANWTHSYNIVLTDSSSVIVLKWGDGHNEAYARSGSAYAPPTGVHNSLVKNSDGTYVLTQKGQTQYSFTSAGSLSSIVDKNGNRILFGYDANGNLIQVTDTVGRALTLAYDSSHRIIGIRDPIGRKESFTYTAENDLATVTDPAGGVTTYTYDGSHHVTSTTLPNKAVLFKNTYDAAGRVVTQTNGRGFTTAFAYDTPNPSQTTITDPLGNTTIHSYDSLLRITAIKDALGGTISYVYDADNNRISVTDQNGHTTNSSYDAQGNVTGVTDPLGDVATFTYDAKNNLLTSTTPLGNTTTFSYDSKGNLATIQDALGNKTAYTYDTFGEIVSKTDPKGNVTTYAYGPKGNLIGITNSLGDTTRMGYDGIGRLTAVTDANGNTSRSTYDVLGRLIEATDPLGSVTQFKYDPIGNLTKVIDANNNATSYAYDAVSNLTSVTDANKHVTTYAFDANNNRTSFTNAKGKTTSYAYDQLNRLVQTTDPLSLTTVNTYDAVGNATSVKDANGHTSNFGYDALNRLITTKYFDGTSVTHAYDADGNRVGLVDTHGITTYSYDTLERLVSVASPSGTVHYAYDPVGKRAAVTYPDGKVVTYGYDALNRLSSVTDWLNQTTSYAYDPASNLTGASYPNETAVAVSYDAANRATQIQNSYQGSAIWNTASFTTFTYALDPVGNPTQVTDGGGNVTSYSYDPLYQLKSVANSGGTTKYAYDAVGNRVSLNGPGGSVTYTYDADDRLLKAGSTSYTYDADGNRLSSTSTAKTLNYAYDATNRLVAVSGGQSASFTYDGEGNRLTQASGASAYTYVNDAGAALPVVLQESGPHGFISYAYGVGLVSESGTSFEYFYHRDRLGSVIGLSDASGILQQGNAYGAWGAATASVPNNLGNRNKFRFAGEALDSETGLYFLRARYYDPTVGRFLTKDRFPGFAAQPKGTNRFGYVSNNPVTFTDPSGNFLPVDDLIAVGVGAAIGVGAQFVGDVVLNVQQGKPWNSPRSEWQDYVAAAAKGAIGGFLVVNPELALVAPVISAGTTVDIDGLTGLVRGQKVDLGQALTDGLVSAIPLPFLPKVGGSLRLVLLNELHSGAFSTELSLLLTDAGVAQDLDNLLAGIGLASGAAPK